MILLCTLYSRPFNFIQNENVHVRIRRYGHECLAYYYTHNEYEYGSKLLNLYKKGIFKYLKKINDNVVQFEYDVLEGGEFKTKRLLVTVDDIIRKAH